MNTDRLKFFHFNYKDGEFAKTMQSHTVVTSLPTAEAIRNAIDLFLRNQSVNITMEFGYTKVHPEDNYHKKFGRWEVRRHMKEIVLSVERIEINASHVYVHFNERVAELFVISLRLNIKTNHATVMCSNTTGDNQ